MATTTTDHPSGISGALSSHPGPGRRFSIHIDDATQEGFADATLDGWLRSPALDNLHELEISFCNCLSFRGSSSLQLPASVFRFCSTLRFATFAECVFPADGVHSRSSSSHHHHHHLRLKQLTLFSVTISESSLHAWVAACPVLESLLLLDNNRCPRLRIKSPSLRSIGVRCRWKYKDVTRLQVVIEDAPCLERLVSFYGVEMDVSVISAPRLSILGQLYGNRPMIQYGTGGLQGSSNVGLAALVPAVTAVLPTVRILALSYVKPCLVINLIKCFPCLEKLHVTITHVGEEYACYDEYWELSGTLDIRLRKIVVRAYCHDRKSHIDFAKFFVMNASLLESMTLQLKQGRVGDSAWIRRQHRLLQIEKRASMVARIDFVHSLRLCSLPPHKQVHDPSILDPFQMTE